MWREMKAETPRSPRLIRAFKAEADHKSDPGGKKVCLEFFCVWPLDR